MAISLDLTQFKSAGVYTLEYDNTIANAPVNAAALRLLVGFNKKGPFNRPVFLSSEEDIKNIFGDIDTKLERKGCFFNRFAQTMVPTSPIFALNLLSTDDSYDGPDQVNYAALSLDSGTPNPAVLSNNITKYGETDYNVSDSCIYADGSIFQLAYNGKMTPYVGNAPYSSFYDRTHFWVPSEDNVISIAAKGLNDNKETTIFNAANFLNIANVGTEELSVLIFKPENISGYDIPAEKWYGSKSTIPYGFIRPDDYMSDYFIQLVIVKGNWSNAASLSTNTTWSKYFTSKGIRKSMINSFLTTAGISVLGSYIGSIIPDFEDMSGNNQNIVTKVNQHTEITGILISFNKDAAQGLSYSEEHKLWYQDIDQDGNFETNQSEAKAPYLIDLVGHDFHNGYKVNDSSRYGFNFMSYNYDSNNTEEIINDINFASYVDNNVKNTFIVANSIAAAKLKVGDFVINNYEDPSSALIPGITRIVNKTASNVVLSTADRTAIDADPNITLYKVKDASFVYKNVVHPYNGYVIVNQALKKEFFWVYNTIEDISVSLNNSIDISTAANTTYPVNLLQDTSVPLMFTNGNTEYDITLFFDADESNNIKIDYGTDNNEGIISSLTANVKFSVTIDSSVVSNLYVIDNNNQTYLADGISSYNIDILNKTFDGSLYTDVSGNTIANDASYRVTEVLSNITGSIDIGGVIQKQLPISDDKISGSLKFIPLKGLSIEKRHMPGFDASGNVDAEAGVEKIYSLLMNDKGIFRGLTNPNMVDFRYIIDSMGYGLGSMLGGKVYLSQLASKRKSCTVLLNAPSKRQFAASANPYFCDTFNEGLEIKPAFDTKYLKTGGNEELYHTKTFTLPDLENGASYTATFWPWLTYTVNGKTFNVPPAADVANVFIRKYTGGDPYMICANTNGILSNTNITGVEYSADTSDRDVLEPLGINTIIQDDNDIMIFGNQTAYQEVLSDLNKLHVRENLNTLELNCKDVLKRFVFLYNNATTRGEIITKLTPIFSAMVTSGAIDSYSLKCDSDNNTSDIIAEDYGVVDAEVIFNHGMEKIVTKITITKSSITIS